MAIPELKQKQEESFKDSNGEIEETEDDLIANYRFLTEKCGALRQSPSIDVLNKVPSTLTNYQRPYSSVSECQIKIKHIRSPPPSARRQINDLNNNNAFYESHYERIPATIFYDDANGSDFDGKRYRSFSLVRLFTRLKTRMKHDRRYREESKHEILTEEESQEWYELTKNVRTILTKALLPDGGYEARISQPKRTNSARKSRDFKNVLPEIVEQNDQITINVEEDEETDEHIWTNFLNCSRGFHHRRVGICKAVDRLNFQGQLVYFYGVANNILIDENLRASGLG